MIETIFGVIALVAICWAAWRAGLLERGAERPTDDERAEDDKNADRLNRAFKEASDPMPLDDVFRKGGAL